jgi:hypothetical protein
MLDKLRSRMKVFLWIAAIAFIISIGAGTIFGSRRRDRGQATEQGLIGVVEGVPIQYRDFSEEYRQRIVDYAQRSGSEVSDATRDAIREETWNSMVTDILVTNEIARMGIDVPDRDPDAPRALGRCRRLLQKLDPAPDTPTRDPVGRDGQRQRAVGRVRGAEREGPRLLRKYRPAQA